jgi:hypothetical protein
MSMVFCLFSDKAGPSPSNSGPIWPALSHFRPRWSLVVVILERSAAPDASFHHLPTTIAMPSPDFNEAEPAVQPAAPILAPIFASGRVRHPSILEQIKSTPRERLQTRHLDDLPRILISDGKLKGEWVLESWLHSERARTSWVSENGLILLQITHGAAGAATWFCRHCDARRVHKAYAFAATTSAEKYLKKQHRLGKASPFQTCGRQPTRWAAEGSSGRQGGGRQGSGRHPQHQGKSRSLGNTASRWLQIHGLVKPQANLLPARKSNPENGKQGKSGYRFDLFDLFPTLVWCR